MSDGTFKLGFFVNSENVRRKKLYKQYEVESIPKKNVNYLRWELE